MMSVVVLLIGCLVTWRIASLLVHEAGPFDMFGRLRDATGIAYDEQSQRYGKNVVAEMLLCLWCTSIWAGWAVALVTGQNDWMLHGLAYSAGAIIIEKWLRGS